MLFTKISEARIRYEELSDQRICLECGDPIIQAGVVYDVQVALAGEKKAVSALLHTACAVTMGTRLISDAYATRRAK